MEFKSKNVHRELCTDLNRVIIKKPKSFSNISLNTDNVMKSKPPTFPKIKKKKKESFISTSKICQSFKAVIAPFSKVQYNTN